MAERKSVDSSYLRQRRVSQLCVFTWLLLAGFWSTTAQAQTCGVMYLSIGDTTHLNEINDSTSPFTYIDLGDAGIAYNALAYRPADDTLYAVQLDTNTLLQVSALDGSVSVLGDVTDLPSPHEYRGGAFAPDGFMYVAGEDDNTLYQIDVESRTATPLGLSQTVNITDLAWFDGLFYFVDNADFGDRRLKSLDIVSGTVTTIGTGQGVGLTGAMFSAVNGVFGIRNEGQGFFQFDITTGEATLISSAPSSNTIDGAHCLSASFQLTTDLSVTKDDGSETYDPGAEVVYEIVVTNSGPFGVQNASVSDPLPDGINDASWECTGADDGVCGAEMGSGAIVDTPDLPPGASVTYTLTATVPPDNTGDLVNTVTVELPEGFIDSTPDDNTATDTNTNASEPVPTLPSLAVMLLVALLAASALATLRRARAPGHPVA